MLNTLTVHLRPEQQSLLLTHAPAPLAHVGCCWMLLLLLLPPPPTALISLMSTLQHVAPALAMTVGHKLLVNTPSDIAVYSPLQFMLPATPVLAVIPAFTCGT